MDLIIQIYLWVLIIICLFTGSTMIILIRHKKHHPENAEATEKWIDSLQTGFWSFVLIMGLLGLVLFVASTHSWL